MVMSPPNMPGDPIALLCMHTGFLKAIAAIALPAEPLRCISDPLAGAVGRCHITAASPGKAIELR